MKDCEKVFVNIDELDDYFEAKRRKFEEIYHDAIGHNKTIMITKVSDNPPKYRCKGISSDIKTGYSVFINNFNTSVVTEIKEEEGIFKTLNSTYEYLIYEE